jgi:hypothetical protein
MTTSEPRPFDAPERDDDAAEQRHDLTAARRYALARAIRLAGPP